MPSLFGFKQYLPLVSVFFADYFKTIYMSFKTLGQLMGTSE